MAYIPPNSEIRLLINVPLDETRQYTLYFSDITQQTNYFIQKTSRVFTANSYVRKGRGYIKLQCPADQIYDCNYMMYRNTSYSNKWFYAFCRVEYVNDNTSSITFQIDQMQTWFFNFQRTQCFVEREHSASDNIGENLVPENLEKGDYLYTDSYVPDLGSMKIVIAATFLYQPPTGVETYGTLTDVSNYVYGGLYSGIWFNTFEFSDDGVNKAGNCIATAVHANKADGIVTVFMCPSKFWNQNEYHDVYQPYSETITSVIKPVTFDGYIPRNNKLWTEPYVAMLVKTPNNAAEFAYEYFQNPNLPQFKLTYAISTSPSILLEPINYKTDFHYPGQAISDNFIEGLTLDGFPQCAYNIDTFKAWLAQNGASLIVNGALAVGGLIGTIASGIATGGYSEAAMAYPGLNGASMTPVTQVAGPPEYMGSEPTTTFSPSGAGIMGSLGAIGNILAQVYQHSTLPNQARGSINSTALFVKDRINFYFCVRQIRPEFAQIIDQFFDRFGYACHRIKVPNIHVRQRWTYTKTIGCEVEGNIPSEARDEINAMFNAGITFWDASANVGDFTASNLPLT